MTLIVVAIAAALALFVGRRSVEDARAVGFPESASTSTGALRLSLGMGLATFAVIVVPWVAFVEA